MERVFFSLGSLSALIAVALGAFAAHGLKARLAPELLGAFEVGVRYQMYHALAMFAASRAAARWPRSTATLAGTFFLIGVIVFSGTCYALAVGAPRWLGAVTPLGGLALLIGWGLLAWSAVRG